MDTRDIYKLVRELSEERDDVVNLYDSMDLELSEDFVIETGIVGFMEDGVIVHLDEDAMEMLDLNGVLFESVQHEDLQEEDDGVEDMDMDRFIEMYNVSDDAFEVIYDAIKGEYGNVVRQAMQEMYDDIVIDSAGRLHPDDDFEQIISHIIDQLESDHGVNEGYYEEEAHPAANAIYRRIINSHPELVQKFTVREISDACNDYAEGIGDIEEIGSSDVSIWTKDVIDDLLSRNKELSEIKKLALGEAHTKECPHCDGTGGHDRLTSKGGYHTVPCNKCGGTGRVDGDEDEEVAEGLGKALLGGAALIAAITGINKYQADQLMKNEPQLVKLAQMRQAAEKQGDEYKVQELDDRIEKTLDHIRVTGRPVMGPNGEPVVPGEPLGEAEYQGRKVQLNKPMQGDVKKSKVYVKKPNGKVVKVNFGDKNMKIKKSNPERRKSFRARHHCDNPGPKWKARYWSCRAW